MKLSDLKAGLEKIFVQQHMSKDTLKIYLDCWNSLQDFLTRTYGDDVYDTERGMRYFRERFGLSSIEPPVVLTRWQLRVLRTLNVLGDYQQTGGVAHMHYTRKKPPVLAEKFASFMAEYVAALRSEGLSKCRIDGLRRTCEHFLLHLTQMRIDDFSKVDVASCESFIKTLAQYNPRTISNALSSLRHLLRFLKARKMISVDLAGRIHGKKVPAGSLIPSGWSSQELQKLLDSITRRYC